MYLLKETVCFKLMLIRDKIHDFSKKEFQKIGITYGNYVTMLLLYENPGVTQAGLSDLNHKDRNVMGQTIDKLEKMMYAERRKVESDRRAYTLYLTEKGKEIVRTYWDTAKGGELELFKRLTQKEQETFCAILDKLSD